MADIVIEVRNLHKSYGDTVVLRGLDLVVPRGEAFGLLGPNGAGKSTLLLTLLGMLKPNEGTVEVLGKRNVEQASMQIGYLPERSFYHLQFTAREYLQMLGGLSGLSGKHLRGRIDDVLEQVGLENVADRRLGTYSKGMLQRFGFSQAILHDPPLVIADEPGSGLDPAAQADMAQLLRRLHDGGRTILLCTHQLTEAARLCDRVGVLINGRLDRVATMAEIHAQGQSMTFRMQELPGEVARRLEGLSPHIHCTHGSVTLFPTSRELQHEVLQILFVHSIDILAMTPGEDALEQFYLQAVHRRPVDPATPRTEDELLQTLVGGRQP
ncbi:MAG: ABC transporter ATP-binding protein [Herpetosiphon sp.]